MVYKPEVQCYAFLDETIGTLKKLFTLKSNRENHGIVKILSLGHNCLYDYLHYLCHSHTRCFTMKQYSNTCRATHQSHRHRTSQKLPAPPASAPLSSALSPSSHLSSAFFEKNRNFFFVTYFFSCFRVRQIHDDSLRKGWRGFSLGLKESVEVLMRAWVWVESSG